MNNVVMNNNNFVAIQPRTVVLYTMKCETITKISRVRRGTPSPPKRGLTKFQYFFKRGGKSPPHPPGFFLIIAYFSKLYERARCFAPSQRLHCVLRNC